VSADFDGDTHSGIVDLAATMVTGELVKVLAWYDNETGYGQRLYDLCRYIAQQGI
jgi:glyceraldehyde 3-phosphate dehydrogenase